MKNLVRKLYKLLLILKTNLKKLTFFENSEVILISNSRLSGFEGNPGG